MSLSIQQQIHASAMQRTADFYDAVVKIDDTSSTLNSLSPTWIADGRISGGIWGPCTDFTHGARAVADAYRFGQRFTDRTYPPQSAGDAPITFEAYETRSLVFRTQEIAQNDTQPGFIGVHVHDRDRSIKTVLPSTPEQPAPCRQETSRETQSVQRFTEDDLNAEYADYLAGNATAEDVLAAITLFIRAKLVKGFNEKTLRKRGLDDILGEFWAKMECPVVEKRFAAEKSSKFSHYVNSAWSNLRAGAYIALDKEDALFRSSTPEIEDDEDAAYRSYEDDHAVALYERAQSDESRETARLTHEIKSMLSDADTAILEALLDTPTKTVVAKRLGISRHVVDRAQERIQTAHARAVVRLSSGKVA